MFYQSQPVRKKEVQATYFGLESQPDRQRLQNAEFMLGSLQDMVILDEIQEKPEFFPVLCVLVDRHHNPILFLILGSISPELIRNISKESDKGVLPGFPAQHGIHRMVMD